jgi:hypothetical protein
MTETFMPGFRRYPDEAAIIGRLLAGYGELEFEMCRCVEAAMNDFDAAFKLIFARQGERKRIERADTVMRPKYNAVGIDTDYETTIGGMDHCRRIRNQYAHSTWYDTKPEGLCILNLEDTAKLATPVTSVVSNRRSIDVALLRRQEDFFGYIQLSFWHLHWAYETAMKRPTAIDYQMPAAITPPPLHN